MSTLDDINNTLMQKEKLNGIKMQQDIAKEHHKSNMAVGAERASQQPLTSDKQSAYPSIETINQENNGNPTQDGNTDVPVERPRMFYQDMFSRLSNYKPQTKEDIEEERKKQKREMTFAAIRDGLNALHQSYSAARGIKPITDNTKLTDKMRERYERLEKERDARNREYANGMLRAASMDQEQANWREKLDYQKGRDKRNDDFQREQFDYKKEIDKKTFDRQSEQWQKEFELRQKQFGMQNALAWARQTLAEQTRKDNKEIKMAGTASKIRGKSLPFENGEGGAINIYENVWKANMQQVYDAMLEEFEQRRKNGEALPLASAHMQDTQQKKEDFVKQNWHKSAAAKQLMKTLSNIDPAGNVSTSESGNGLGWGNDNTNETDW